MLCKVFIDVFNHLSDNTAKKKILKLNVTDYDTLEKTLEEYLVSILGPTIKNNYKIHFREIRKYFENIFNNIQLEQSIDLIESIQRYGVEYRNKLTSHPYVETFIEALQELYSPNYDGKVNFGSNYPSTLSQISTGGGY